MGNTQGQRDRAGTFEHPGACAFLAPPERLLGGQGKKKERVGWFRRVLVFERFGLFSLSVQSAVRLTGLLQSLVPAVPTALTSMMYFTPAIKSANVWVVAVSCSMIGTAPGVFGVRR